MPPDIFILYLSAPFIEFHFNLAWAFPLCDARTFNTCFFAFVLCGFGFGVGFLVGLGVTTAGGVVATTVDGVVIADGVALLFWVSVISAVLKQLSKNSVPMFFSAWTGTVPVIFPNIIAVTSNSDTIDLCFFKTISFLPVTFSQNKTYLTWLNFITYKYA